MVRVLLQDRALAVVSVSPREWDASQEAALSAQPSMSFGRQSAHTIDSPNAVAVGHESPNAIPHPTEPITRLQSWATRTPERYIVPICGGFAGAVSGLVSCPLDVIKTKLQAQGGFQIPKNNVKLTTAAYRGVYGTAATIWTEEGVRGMYRGLGPMLLGYVPTWAVYLTVYNRTQAFFRTKTGKIRILCTFDVILLIWHG